MDLLWHYFLCLNITSGFNSSLSFAWYLSSDGMLPLYNVFQDILRGIHGKRRNWINIIFCVIGCQSLYAYVRTHTYARICVCFLYIGMCNIVQENVHLNVSECFGGLATEPFVLTAGEL